MVNKKNNSKQQIKYFGEKIDLPEDWEITEQQNVCEFINGYAFSESEFSNSGYHIIRIQNLTGGENYVFSNVKLPEKQFAVKGDLLFTWSGTFLPFIWQGEKSAFHYHQWKIIPKNSEDKMFLYYHLERIADIIKNMGQSGLGMFHMTKAGMEKLPILIPKDISERKKISETLLDVDKLIKVLESLIQKKKNIKQGTMQELLTGKMRLEGFSCEWQQVKFDSLCKSFTKQTGFDYSANIKPKLVTTSHIGVIPFIQNKDFNAKKINFDTDYYIPENIADNYSDILLDEKCLLISISGSIGNVGIFSNLKKAFVGGAVGVAKFKNKDNLEWVLYYLLSNEGKKKFFKDTKSGAHHNLTVGGIRDMIIPLPLPDEQAAITKILSDMDFEIQQLEKQLNKYTNLKQAMMQKLLTGEIRLV